MDRREGGRRRAADGGEKKFLLKRMLLIPLGVVALAATLLAQGHPDWAEAYGRTVYPALSSAVGFLPSLVGFSVAEWAAGLFLLFCLGYVAYYVRKIVVGKGERGLIAYRAVMGAVAIACVAFFSFTALCGLNYHRHTFSSYTGYDAEMADIDAVERQEELERLAASLAEGLGRERAELGVDADLFAAQPGEFERYARESVAAMRALAERYPVLERPLYSPPKPVLASKLMSYANIGGMFFPFTMESNINVDNPFFSVPGTMAHELAHQCGFMREDEANFIAYLACKESGDALMRYSGLLLAYDNAMGALRKVDPEAASRIAAGLAPAVQRDLAQRAQHWAQYEGPVQDASNAANDAYLKANNQSDGMQSYGRMVDLLLAEQRAEANDPVDAQGELS
ncbi:DUF3810 domain-containing protein [Gordonibacter sp. 28C]|uniref:DUF3810 domain-containing protein n=1 Tax=Gordonibacter sp. 28C TaxID=2078569 RepID=UPI001F541B6A|nr:DUF3810 domain-containing protein [Gordonibacter sp. 28C]